MDDDPADNAVSLPGLKGARAHPDSGRMKPPMN